MQAYATAERIPELAIPALRLVAPRQTGPVDGPDTALLDQVLVRLADLVAEKIADRIVRGSGEEDERWFDTRAAAEYLGVHRDTIRRLAAERAIPAEQAGAGCKLYFRRRDLDRWRRTAVPSVPDAVVGHGRAM